MAIVLARYRWVFLAVSIASIVVGFYFNVLRRSTRLSQAIFWLSSVITLLTILDWGWWRL